MLSLRDHPLMSYRRLGNWPSEWSWLSGQPNKNVRGEIGVLRSIVISDAQSPASCFLYIDHEGASYMGCLLFSDPIFCREVVTLLEGYLNRSIEEIGSLDVSHTL